MINPLEELLYCRFRCHGREKLGSECTQKTCMDHGNDGCFVHDITSHSVTWWMTHHGLCEGRSPSQLHP